MTAAEATSGALVPRVPTSTMATAAAIASAAAANVAGLRRATNRRRDPLGRSTWPTRAARSARSLRLNEPSRRAGRASSTRSRSSKDRFDWSGLVIGIPPSQALEQPVHPDTDRTRIPADERADRFVVEPGAVPQGEQVLLVGWQRPDE